MRRRDKYHDAVKNAFIKDGWVITHDPFFVTFGKRNLQIDLGAETALAAEKGGRVIAVEVKSFLADSALADFYMALGQYRFYRYCCGARSQSAPATSPCPVPPTVTCSGRR